MDAYETLGITNSASKGEIDRAFHKQMAVAASMSNASVKQKYIDDLTKAYEMIRATSFNLPPLSEYPEDPEDLEAEEYTRGWGILQSDLPIWAKGLLVTLRIILAIVCLPLLILFFFFSICGKVAAFIVSLIAGGLGLIVVLGYFAELYHQYTSGHSYLTLTTHLVTAIIGGLCFAAAALV